MVYKHPFESLLSVLSGVFTEVNAAGHSTFDYRRTARLISVAAACGLPLKQLSASSPQCSYSTASSTPHSSQLRKDEVTCSP